MQKENNELEVVSQHLKCRPFDIDNSKIEFYELLELM